MGTMILVAAVLLVTALGYLVGRAPLNLDREILERVRGTGPAWLHRAAIDLTALGSGTVLTLLVLAAAVLLMARRQFLVAASLVAASWSGGRVVEVAKHVVGRTRPDVADRLVPVASASFPSAHAANSAVVYLTLAGLVAAVVHDRAGGHACVVLAVMLVGIIGVSRVYLGVHWPSDVAAGWGFGAVWAVGWWRITTPARRSWGLNRR